MLALGGVGRLRDGGFRLFGRLGEAGLYREGTMFAVLADDVAYLKVDDSNRDDFVRAGSAPFEPYPEKIKTTIRTYHQIPADVLEDPAELAQWAQRSWLVARKRKSEE